MDIAIQIVAASRAGQDRAEAFSKADGHLLVLADGAGGTSGGAKAADTIVATVGVSSPASASDCVRLLEDLDRRLTTIGQSTAVLVVVSHGHVFGASVGDSAAWLVGPTAIVDLTEYQRPKPLLGSGNSIPVGFGPVRCEGRILVGSDGLFKYVPHQRLRELAITLPLAEVPEGLVHAARLKSGRLQDDIAVIVAGQLTP